MPSSIQVRPFRRDDRDQLTHLVNAHVAAVVPGVSVSVHTVLRHLEREPGELRTADQASTPPTGSFLAAAGFTELTRTARGWYLD